MRFQASVIALALLVAPAASADCPFERAVYTQPQSAYELHFRPSEANAFGNVPANAFAVRIPSSELRLDGVVQLAAGASQPRGQVLLECEPDMLPDQCRIWSGPVYELRDGIIGSISPGSAAAPDQLVLTELQHFLFNSNLRWEHGIEQAPWDVFTFDHCAT